MTYTLDIIQTVNVLFNKWGTFQNLSSNNHIEYNLENKSNEGRTEIQCG